MKLYVATRIDDEMRVGPLIRMTEGREYMVLIDELELFLSPGEVEHVFPAKQFTSLKEAEDYIEVMMTLNPEGSLMRTSEKLIEEEVYIPPPFDPMNTKPVRKEFNPNPPWRKK